MIYQETTMKKTTIRNERGQALVLIALAAIGLFGFAALAIDGSMVFSDRRHAQNAADTSVLDAALAKTRGQDWVAQGLDRADSNGYDDNGTSNDVYVHLCSSADATCTGLPAGADPGEYIQVRIRSDVNLLFARVIGRPKATNYVDAVARAVPSTYEESFEGSAVVGLAEDECRAVKYQGNATTQIIGGGIFVMSSCDNGAFFNNSSAAQLTAPSICAVGDVVANTTAMNVPSIRENCVAPTVPAEPNPTCSGNAERNGNVLSPGFYSGAQFPPAGVDTLESGVYCVDGDFRINGGDSLTGLGVVIRMNSGVVSWLGGAYVHLEAPTEGPYAGKLIYLPSVEPANCSPVTLNGNSASVIVGSIIAPCSAITVNGTGDSGIVGRIIGYTVDLGGGSGTKIYYDNALYADDLMPPEVEFKQ
jgi:hypothetical protein